MTIFEKAFGILLQANPAPEMLECLKLSKADVHADGMYSIVLEEKDGFLLRFFHATKDVKFGDIAFHTHQYALTIGVVKGEFKHHVATHGPWYNRPALHTPVYMYKSAITHGKPEFELESKNATFDLVEYSVAPGMSLELQGTEFHTVSVKAGTTWLIQEKALNKPAHYGASLILGLPFEAPKHYDAPAFMVLHLCGDLGDDLSQLLMRA